MPALVTPAVWEAANRAADRSRTAHAKTQPKSQRLYAIAGRIFHAHDEPTDVEALIPMHGMSKQKSYTLKDGETRTSYDRRYYACRRPRKGEEGCSGIGDTSIGKRPRKALQASAVEAGVLLWGLNLLDDPERLAEYVSTFDRDVLGADTTVDALRKAEAAREAALNNRKNVAGLVGSGALHPDEAADQLSELARQVEESEAIIERMQAARMKSESLRFSVEWLANSTDPAGDFLEALKTAAISDGAWWPEDVEPVAPLAEGDDWAAASGWLRSEALDVLRRAFAPGWGRGKRPEDRPRELHPAAQEWTKQLAARFDLRLIVTGTDPASIKLIGTAPTAALAMGDGGEQRRTPS